MATRTAPSRPTRPLRATAVAKSVLRDSFVGRRAELQSLRTAVRGALEGRGGIRIITGEPGVGKTRLAEEVAAAAAMCCLRGRCSDFGGAPPYWPWTQAIRPFLAASSRQEIRADWGAGARVAGALFPELCAVFGRRPGPRLAEDEDALGFGLLDALASFLVRASGRRPLLILIDDLQWADRRSLELLRDVGRRAARSHLLVLGTLRQTEIGSASDASRTVGELAGDPAFEEIPLSGLSVAEVERYLELTVGARATAGIPQSVHALTGGNPLYLSQIATTPDALEGRRRHPPEGVHHAIAGRLAALRPWTRELLEAASLFTDSFGVEQLAAVLQADAGRVLGAVDEALHAHLVTHPGGESRDYRFLHGLIRDCLRADLPLDRLTSLHAAVAALLERSYRPGDGPAAAVLMSHFAAARPLVGPRPVAVYARDAARHALYAGAWEDALRYADFGIEALGPQAMDDLEAELLSLRTYTLHVSSGLSLPLEASEPLALAFEQYERSGNAPLALELVRRMGAWLVARYGGSFRDRAMRFAAPGSPEAVMVLTIHALGLGGLGADYPAARATFDEAIALAERLGDLHGVAWALRFLTTVEQRHLHVEEAVRVAERALQVAAGIDEPRLEHYAHIQLAYLLAPLGRGAEARHHALRAAEAAEAREDRLARLEAAACEAQLAFDSGELGTARTIAERGLAASPAVGTLRWSFRRVLAAVASSAGRFQEARAQVSALVDWARSEEANWRRYAQGVAGIAMLDLAVASGDPGDLDTLRVFVGPATRPDRLPPLHAQLVKQQLAELAWLSRDAEAARALYAALRDEPVSPSRPRLWVAKGVLARMLGMHDEAVAVLRSAQAVVNWSVPSDVHRGHELALTLSERGAPGDRRQALAAWTEARERADRHGLAAWSQRIGAALAQHRAGAAGHGPADCAGLTKRELEVLRLVAAGRTNKGIAAELSISERTVELHVGKVLAKTGSANRTEAANYAHRYDIA